jgi:PilZ domain
MSTHQHSAFTERRTADRIRANLKAAIFVPADETEIECGIENLSTHGAGVRCETSFAPGTLVVLYIRGFGRFEATVERREGDHLGVSFQCGLLKRKRLAEQLLSFVQNGGVATTSLRRHERTPTISLSELTLEGGGQLNGRVLDVSLLGVSIKTDQRPPIGTTVNVGRTAGRVVRHHEVGIGIEFS